MFLGDKGKADEFPNIRRNYDIIIDNPNLTLQKLSRNLGFYTILPQGRSKEVEIVYDTDRLLLTGAGLILRKKMAKERTYFSLVRISTMSNVQDRERKSFLGECEPNDAPADFPVQIADGINKIFNNLFTISIVDIVKRCEPYLKFEILADNFKLVSGTGYEVEFTFETLKVRDLRTGRKANVRNFSMKMELNPAYEHEREHILDVIEHKCKELFFVNRNRFEIAQAAVKIPERKQIEQKPEKKKKRQKEEIETEEEQ